MNGLFVQKTSIPFISIWGHGTKQRVTGRLNNKMKRVYTNYTHSMIIHHTKYTPMPHDSPDWPSTPSRRKTSPF